MEERVQELSKLTEAYSKITELENVLKEANDENARESTTTGEKTTKKTKKQFSYKPTLASQQRELFIKSKNATKR